MFRKHLQQAEHNESFLDCITKHSPKNYFDWKITVIFYIAVHYVDAYLVSHGIIVHDHNERNNQIEWGGGEPYSFNEDESNRYSDLYRMCRNTRYKCFIDKKSWEKQLQKDLKDCEVHIEVI